MHIAWTYSKRSGLQHLLYVEFVINFGLCNFVVEPS